MYIYEEAKVNLYVHHDVLLSSFPICIETLPVQPASFGEAECERGNLCIVGSFLPHIEIWDLDILDCVEPSLVLEGVEAQLPKKKKNKKKKKPSAAQGHSDAVISLSLNNFKKNVLASGSADKTVKIWDLSSQQVVITEDLPAKPDSLGWSPANESVLFVAGDNFTIRAADIRQKTEIGSFTFESHIENFCIDNSGQELHLSFENGYLGGIDLRAGFKPSYELRVSKKEVTSVCANEKLKGMLGTTCGDSVIRVYDSNNRGEGNVPVLVDQKLTRAVS